MLNVWRKGLITPVASGGNVTFAPADSGLPKMIYICSNDASNHAGTPWTLVNKPVEIFPPIPYGSIQKIVRTSAVAEVPQITTIGLDTAETILASTRYKISGYNTLRRYEGSNTLPISISYTSPAVLSGTPQTDMVNVYTVLVNKMNARVGKTWTAYLMLKVAFTTGSSVGDLVKNLTIGETLTQATSLATAKVAGVVISTGTFYGDNAAGFLYLYNVNANWSATSYVSTGGTSAAVVTTAAIPVVQGMTIVDDAGYYAPFPSTRKGINAWKLENGFTSAVVNTGESTATTFARVVGANGVYPIGTAAEILAKIGVFNIDRTDTVSGSAEMVLNAFPVTGRTYTRYNIYVNTLPPVQRVADIQGAGGMIYTLWVDDNGGTNLAAFETALTAVTGVTII